MKRKGLIFICSIVAIFSLVLFTFAFYPTDTKAQSDASKSKISINVHGTATVYAKPDIATLSFGITKEGEKASVVYGDVTANMNKIIKSLKDLGIPSDDIKTLSINVYPKYIYDPKTGKSSIDGFTAQVSLEVKVRNMDLSGKVVDTAFQNGANTFNNITFSVSNIDEYYNKALVKAISQAKTKAKLIADSYGVSLGNPVKVTENVTSNDIYLPIYRSDAKVAAQGATQIESGQVEIRAEVNVEY